MSSTTPVAGRDKLDKSAPEQILENINAHDSSLSSHLNLVQSLNSEVTPQTVSQILDSAEKLVSQFAILKRQLATLEIDAETETKEASTGSQSQSRVREKLKAKGRRAFTETNGKNPEGSRSEPATAMGVSNEKSSKKRSWDSDLSETQGSTDHYSTSTSSQKRPRTKRKIAGAHDIVDDYIPVALQKDDISEEVERRLKLKEERRKKLSAEPDKKRKRDSSGNSKNRLKRSRDLHDGDNNDNNDVDGV